VAAAACLRHLGLNPEAASVFGDLPESIALVVALLATGEDLEVDPPLIYIYIYIYIYVYIYIFIYIYRERETVVALLATGEDHEVRPPLREREREGGREGGRE